MDDARARLSIKLLEAEVEKIGYAAAFEDTGNKWVDAALFAIQAALARPAPAGEGLADTELDEHGEAMVCTGCGTTRTVAAIRAASATAFTCCPERKMVPVRSRMDDYDLRAYGYAPGWYMFRCRDCPEPGPMQDWAIGAKHSWRCRDHAVALAKAPVSGDVVPLKAMRQREMQMIGAALSNKDIAAVEMAYNQLRDKMDLALR